MAVSKEQVRELLGSGLGPEVVASAVGCDISYISQMLSDEAFASDVALLRTKNLTSHNRRDASIDGIEDKLLQKLDSMISEGVFYKPRDVLQATVAVNRMIRRGMAPSTQGAVINNVIQIQIPSELLKKFTRNRANEVVAIEDQTLVTMPAHQLLKSLAAQVGNGEGNGTETYKDALKYLPSGLTTTIRDVPPGESDI